jgi:hypothetical protein
MAAEMTEKAVVKTDPDPTSAVKEALTLAIKNLDDKILQRFNASDKAVELAREEVKTAARDLAKANADALDAALKTTTNSASKLAESFETANKATNEKIDRLTERINIWTGRDNMVDVSKQAQSTDKGQTISMVALIIGFGGVVVAIATLFTRH